MRQKFEGEDPVEQGKAGGKVDRSQGAARAISVSSSPLEHSVFVAG